MCNKISQAFQNDYRAACQGRAARAATAEGRTFEVRKVQKNGKLGKPTPQFDCNLSEKQAADRKAVLEGLNPGMTFAIVNTAA
jgi:hypothetical protein